jgi:hypothetical protein
MCIGCPGNNSIFGNTSQFIKIQGSDFVAIEGVNTVERLIGSDIRIPYKQLLKSRVILKAGQANYLLNHLGLGDNATFLAIKATYNNASVNEEDNYVDYYYYDDLSSRFSFNQLIVLTGNSQNRVKQLYLTNPNTKYSVTLDVMVAIIDEEYSFFNDTVNQSATTFTGLSYTDIESYVVGESIVINDINGRPLIYLNLSNINSISRSSTILTIDDDTFGSILLVFNTEFDAQQAHSLLSYVLSNPNINIADIDPLADQIDPVIYFYSNVGNTASGYTISSYMTASVPTYAGGTYSQFGYTFSTSLSLSIDGTSSVISKNRIIELIIASASDNRDGILSVTSSNIILTGTLSNEVSSITSTGTYSMTFDFSDIAQNYLDGVIMYLDIIS